MINDTRITTTPDNTLYFDCCDMPIPAECRDKHTSRVTQILKLVEKTVRDSYGLSIDYISFTDKKTYIFAK